MLISKLIDIGVRRSLIPWIISFLSNRRQCVRLGGATSDWLRLQPVYHKVQNWDQSYFYNIPTYFLL